MTKRPGTKITVTNRHGIRVRSDSLDLTGFPAMIIIVIIAAVRTVAIVTRLGYRLAVWSLPRLFRVIMIVCKVAIEQASWFALVIRTFYL
jgi:hypothetical protein